MEIYVAKDGERIGPYSEAQLKEQVAASKVALSDLAWHAGLSDWTPVACLIEPAEAKTAPPSDSPPAIPANLAGRWVRLGAVVLDIVALGIAVLPGLIVVWAGGHDETMTTAGTILCVAGFIALATVQLIWLTTRGQTIGKRIVGVKIVKYADNSNPGFLHAVVYRAILPGIIGRVPFLGLVFWIVDVCFIFSQERRCLHDLIASTKVVEA